MLKEPYKSCRLCARDCGADRTSGVGYCKMPADIYVGRAALHMWEEPPISGRRGSGTVFFSGCSLGCIFCQNKDISRSACGRKMTVRELASEMLALQAKGAHNINFVTPTHYAPSVKDAVSAAREGGLKIPIVYNTGTFDKVETLRMLEGTVDIYLPDLKYYRSESASKFSSAPSYPENAKAAIAEMVRQTGGPIFDSDGIMKRGTVVRILLLPGRVAEAKLSLSYLYKTYSDTVYISLMSQYTPVHGMTGVMSRRVTAAEYDQLVSYAEKLGVKNCFIQSIESADEAFIPDFNV